MPAFGLFTAEIRVDDVPLPEFGTTVTLPGEGSDSPPTVECWIPSTVGKAFTFHWADTDKPRTASAGDVYVDGASVGDALLIYAGSGKNNSAVRRDVCVNAGERQTLVFSTLRFLENDDEGSEPHTELGSLALTLTPCVVEGVAPRRVPETTAALGADAVGERTKKAGAHVVRLGKRVRAPSARRAVHYHKTGEPLVRFVWRYRPLDVLRAIGVAPRLAAAPASTTTSPLARRPSSTLSDEEREQIRRMEAEIAQLRAKLGKERPARKRPRVIDLTADD